MAATLTLATAVPARAAGRRVSASEWTAAVCSDFARWDARIGRSGAPGRLADASAGKTAIQRLLGSLRSATDTLVGDLAKAGIPAVRDGQVIAQTFRDIATRLRDAFSQAEMSAAALPTDDPAKFGASAQVIHVQLNATTGALIASLGPAIGHSGSAALDKAFRTSKACGRVVHA